MNRNCKFQLDLTGLLKGKQMRFNKSRRRQMSETVIYHQHTVTIVCRRFKLNTITVLGIEQFAILLEALNELLVLNSKSVDFRST